MTDQTRILRACNGRLDLIDGFSWPYEKIVNFLEAVEQNPQSFMSPGVLQSKIGAQTAYDIRKAAALCLQLSSPPPQAMKVHYGRLAEQFRNTNATPSQHILRIQNTPGFNSVRKDNESMFGSPFFGQNLRLPYWSPFDLLGLILSLFGPAPPGANDKNFFMPLTALYGMWCSRLGSHLRNPNHLNDNDGVRGVGHLPEVFQFTYRVHGQTGDKIFFLGASIGGYDGGDEDFEDLIKLQRFFILAHVDGVVDNSRVLGKTYSDQKDWTIKYGNCAETYPFVNLLTTRDDGDNSGARGMAFSSKFTEQGFNPEGPYDVNWLDEFHLDACTNCCGVLDEKYAATVENFLGSVRRDK